MAEWWRRGRGGGGGHSGLKWKTEEEICTTARDEIEVLLLVHVVYFMFLMYLLIVGQYDQVTMAAHYLI